MSDEIVVLKKHLSVYHSFTDQLFEEMVKRQTDIKLEIQKAQDSFQRRFNGIIDTLKRINEKSYESTSVLSTSRVPVTIKQMQA
jgi:hypothetical protein